VLIFLPFQHQLKTFPADYIYFNSISGGNKKAWSNYEYDYYFHGIKTASDELKKIIQDEKVIIAGNSNLSNYFEKSENIVYKYSPYLERSSIEWDYGIFGINYIHPEMLKNGKWFSTQTQKVFFHKGNPIAVLLKRSNQFGFEGMMLEEKGEPEQAKILMLNAIKADPNNVWFYSQMAKIALKEKDFNSFSLYLQKGREIYPSYEPFFLLEATYFFNQGDFGKANEVLNKLIEVNNRYKPAKKLLLAVEEKLK
jgi:tetratricopeptide (TPR) repeat protein